jgi:hypothetical protein
LSVLSERKSALIECSTMRRWWHCEISGKAPVLCQKIWSYRSCSEGTCICWSVLLVRIAWNCESRGFEWKIWIFLSLYVLFMKI